jgi:hypothetical protein
MTEDCTYQKIDKLVVLTATLPSHEPLNDYPVWRQVRDELGNLTSKRIHHGFRLAVNDVQHARLEGRTFDMRPSKITGTGIEG